MLRMGMLLLLISCAGNLAFASVFTPNPLCVKGVKVVFGERKVGTRTVPATLFGSRQDEMDDRAYSFLCMNGTPSQAIECVETVAKKFSFMSPWGLAEVCSQNVEGAYAIQCLEIAEILDPEWLHVVDSCSTITRKFVSCVLPQDKHFDCSQDVKKQSATREH